METEDFEKVYGNGQNIFEKFEENFTNISEI